MGRPVLSLDAPHGLPILLSPGKAGVRPLRAAGGPAGAAGSGCGAGGAPPAGALGSDQLCPEGEGSRRMEPGAVERGGQEFHAQTSLGGLQSMGSQRVGHKKMTNNFTFHIKKKLI